MEVTRAKQITESGEVIPVTYEGRYVLIQHVDEERETARIYPKESPGEEIEVPIRLLHEER
jgi:small acid-soluble spore protein H (minor)